MINDGIYEKEFEVMLKDIDKSNKMKLSSYLNFMQEIGAMHSEKFGYGINDEPKTHKAWIVIAWNLEILRRPIWNEKITLKSWIGKIDKIYHYRNYEMLDEKGTIVAKATAKWVMVDTITKKIQKLDENHLKLFPTVDIPGYPNSLNKLSARFDLANSNQIYEYVVQKRDVDTNNHMNNIVYLDVAQEGISDEYLDNISYVEIHYKAECKYNEKIIFMQDKENIYIVDENKEKLHTLVILK